MRDVALGGEAARDSSLACLSKDPPRQWLSPPSPDWRPVFSRLLCPVAVERGIDGGGHDLDLEIGAKELVAPLARWPPLKGAVSTTDQGPQPMGKPLERALRCQGGKGPPEQLDPRFRY